MTNPSQQFIADIYPAAKKVADESRTSLELILAQTAQETGWGQKTLEGTNNLFNFKADAATVTAVRHAFKRQRRSQWVKPIPDIALVGTHNHIEGPAQDSAMRD